MVGNKNAHHNFISLAYLEGEFTFESLRNLYRYKFVEDFEKFSYRIVMKFGDPYYEKIDKDEAFNRAFHVIENPGKMFTSQKEIDMFIEDNLNVKLPLDGPQWRLFL